MLPLLFGKKLGLPTLPATPNVSLFNFFSAFQSGLLTFPLLLSTASQEIVSKNDFALS